MKINPTLPAPAYTRYQTVPPVAKNSSICYKYVGCFNNYPPFDNSGGVLPSPPERVGTIFLLYTNKNSQVGKSLLLGYGAFVVQINHLSSVANLKWRTGIDFSDLNINKCASWYCLQLSLRPANAVGMNL